MSSRWSSGGAEDADLRASIVLMQVLTCLVSGTMELCMPQRHDMSGGSGDATRSGCAEEALRAGEERHRMIVEHSPDLIFVQCNERITFVNPAGVRLLRASSEADILGRSPFDFFHPDFHGILRQRIAVLRNETGTVPVIEERLVALDGTEVPVEATAASFRTGDHFDIQVICRDITERQRTADALRRSNEEYERQRAALVSLSHAALRLSADEAVMLPEITRTVAHAAGVERVSLWRFNRERTAIVCQDLFEASLQRHTSGHELHAAAYPSYFRALAESDIIPAGDACSDPRTCEFTGSYLVPLGISSMLDAPIRVGDRLDGVLCIEHVGPQRIWTQGEQTFAVSVSNLVSLMLSQRAQARSESRLRTIVESEPECVKIVSVDGLLLDMNPAGLRMIEAEGLLQVQGHPVSELVHPADVASFEDLHRRSCAGESGRLVFRIIGLKGALRWMETHSAPLRESGGAITSVLSVTRDITASRLAEETLRASEANMAAAQSIAHFGSWELDLAIKDDISANPLRWSDEMFRISGFEPGTVEVTNELFFSLVHPDDHAVIRQAVAEAIEGRHSYSVIHRLIRRDGEVRIVHEAAQIFFDEKTGEPLKMVGTAHDITEQRQAESSLREQAALLDKAQDAIIVRSLDHRVLYWNQSAERLYGYTQQEALGRSVEELLYRNPADFLSATHKVVTQGEWSGELQQFTRSGEELTVECHWTTVCDEQGNPKSIFAINTDITQRKKLEAQFLRAQRMESIGTLAGGIAHDLNNVLAPIMLSIDLLKLKVTDPEGQETLATIGRSAQRGAEMISQVLSFARGLEGRRVEVQVRHLVRDLVKIAAETFPKNIRIEDRLTPDLWTLEADPTQLHQVLLNLCVNARDAMPGGGQITISAENMTIDEHYAAMNIEARVGPHVKVEVEDTGTGIPKEIMDKIFDPFFTTKEVGKGTGLGLSTTLAIVKSHGGFIRVYSDLGMGTKVRIYLPAQSGTAAEQAETVGVDLPRGNGETVLVVDDEASVRQITKQTLEAFGYRVLLASDGSEAVSTYVQHQPEIAVVLTDMMMPVMDGPATIRVLFRLNPEVRIIAASGITANGKVAQSVDAGVKRFLPKPYTAETLLKAIKLAIADPA